MKVRFLSEADVEFRESARYYEDKAPGLGMAFIAEVHRVAAVVASQPGIGSPVDDELRKFVLRRFPYNMIYAVEGDEVVITAVAHHKRRPFYWGWRGRK
ncbi:MAG: type II toxin-antitoxin system RelE/ParE family toxin [Sulfuricellaceae bacterium]|nr:type II toxin-antitoxin system RelE/ParE family toxin [Sulfuricellaceae bacterium]